MKTPEVVALVRLVEQGLVVLLGPVRQEVLSGIKHRDQFERLRERLAAFPEPHAAPAGLVADVDFRQGHATSLGNLAESAL